MKITVGQWAMKAALNNVDACFASKPTLSQLSCVLITASYDQITITATNLSIWVEVIVQGNVQEEGAIAVPYAQLSNLINLYPDELIHMSSDKMNVFTFKTDNVKTNLKSVDADEYPSRNNMKIDEYGSGIEWKAEDFFGALRKVAVSVSKDAARPITQCVIINMEESSTEFVSVDGYRMTSVTMFDPTESGIKSTAVIHFNDLITLMRMKQESMYVYAYFSEKEIMFMHGVTTLIVKRSEHTPMNLNSIAPNTCAFEIKVNVAKLLQACKQAMIAARDTSYTMKAEVCMPDSEAMNLSKLKLTAGDKTVVSNAEIEITGNGEGTIFGINVQYLVQFLETLDAEEITMQGSANKPLVMFTDIQSNIKHWHLIMPVAVGG